MRALHVYIVLRHWLSFTCWVYNVIVGTWIHGAARVLKIQSPTIIPSVLQMKDNTATFKVIGQGLQGYK